MQDLSLQHMSNILWMFATFAHLPSDVVQAIAEELRTRLKTEIFNAQQLTNNLWSLCLREVEPDVPADLKEI